MEGGAAAITAPNPQGPQGSPSPRLVSGGLTFGPGPSTTNRMATLPSALTSGPITYTASPGMPLPSIGGPPVVVVIQHEGFPPGFGRRPANCICPACHLNIITSISSKPGLIAWVCCCFFLCIFPCFSPV